MKNTQAKTRKRENAYEVWQTPDGTWTWYVLKKYQADDLKPYAKWLCVVVTPICPQGDIGDVYANTVLTTAKKVDKLFFLVDKLTSARQVYSGHSGKGKNIKVYFSDYGKYAMKPATHSECLVLMEKIEKDAIGSDCVFDFSIVPMTDISLCNFYEVAEHEAFEKVQEQQRQIFTNL